MKNLYKSFLVLALSLVAVTTHAAEDKKALFMHNNGNMLNGEYLQAVIRDNGDVHVLRVRGIGSRPLFDEVVDRLDRDQLDYAKAAAEMVKPTMKLRDLTKAEKKRMEGCAMDSAVSWSVPGKQFEHGRLVVRQAQGCGLVIGLATRTMYERRTEVAMRDQAALLDKILEKHRERIYK